MKRLALVFLLACASDAAPVWTGAPTTLHLVQGETQSVPLALTDADGDAVTATFTTSSLETDATQDALVLHAPFDAPATDVLQAMLDDGRGEMTPYAIDVTIDPLGWKPDFSWSASAGPQAREHGTFLIDEASRTVFLIGGSGYAPQGTALDEFWKLDLDAQTWTQVTPTGDVPPALASARAVRMPGTTTAYMFGGYTGDGSTDTGELYRVAYGGGALAFTKLTQVSPPPPRELHGFGYDPTSQNFVVFGGNRGGVGPLADTWIMQLSGDTANWTKLSGPAPTPRYGFFYGTDEVAGRFIVFSGAQSAKSQDPINAAQDTWALDLRADPSSWTRVLDGTEPNHAPGRRNGCFVVDPRGPSLYVFGGTSDGMTTQPGLFALDMRPGHEGFSQIARTGEPPLRSSDFGFYDAKTGAVSCGFGNSSGGIYTDVAAIGP
ncbi:MAG TPA: kelch repeat-containing protein [Polyangiaceae bacterium]|jgi:hypothetical protein